MNNSNSNKNNKLSSEIDDIFTGEFSIFQTISLWWSRFNLRSKLLAFGTLVVSFIMTLITFFALSSIQKDAGMNDTRYARDLGLLLSGNVTELVANNQTRELFNVAEKFWRSSRNLRYIFFTDPDGFVKLGIPVSATTSGPEEESALQLTRKLQLPSELKKQPQFPLVRQHSTPQGQVTDVFVPMLWKGEYLGTLALGVTPNKKALATAALTREITVAVFISIWVLVIIGAVFNALTITRPIKELVIGVREIAKGNFKSRVDLPMSGELGELLNGFNAMASKLEDYDAANIEELKAAQVKQQSLIATMADGALLLDEQGNIVLVNPTARRLFRWEGRNLEGQKLLNQLPDLLVRQLETPITSLLNNFGDSDDLRCNLEEPPRTLRIVLKSVRDTTGENIKGIAVTVQDLTREVQLNAAQKRFISNVSHELRTPLFNIKSYVETLYDLGEQLTKDEQKEFLGVANSETDRLTRLVNDVLDLSKLESGRTIQLEPLSIKEAMEQTLRNYKLNAEDKNVKLKLNVENNLAFVLGNWDMILQVLDNLVGNALKFSQNGGTINLKAYTWPDICVASPVDLENKAPHCEILSPMPKIRVEVSDTGCGISEIDQQRIFERFYRVEDSVHTEVGTGLGLSIVKGIVDKHGSEIRMASEPNIGTTFWFELPLEDSDADQLLLKSARKNWEIENDKSLV
ncbi:ATP-binding protein [Prochlorococcus marinus]|uniref:histidine kinase n=1 Tax=Prochlorococcus marinus XMU1408 TaxID=2213228 RepID=A0A318R2W2_PROMR|nr:ATP-binding protein [Prochlorococcus marinus]MBW3042525.1 PAS domain-containing sensor histidine kinase [Prochlorococcus marinus str. XMU1408]PYE01251.1 PAS domain-containing sensor histidine kinase [Prochlorococcus marinus XMU1408]